ncbi:hypothetical protein ACFQZ2_00975 [Streptomonospora algeriensis]|uniref:ATP-grasp domain-containing protein n=1 Tax=Streptomonospora algeriensis TaxID=995084 RepID=A0ABW3B8Y0_9ACTN
MRQATTTEELKEALVGDRSAEFVWLCNFEVEREWAQGFPGLPAARGNGSAAVVQRMEQLGALLADPGDHLLLGAPLDPGYRDYLASAGIAPAQEIRVDGADTAHAVLESPTALKRLRELANRGAYLMPMGTSKSVAQIAAATGLRLTTPDAETVQKVNSKIYSRTLVDELGLRAVPGRSCTSVDALRSALPGEGAGEPPLIVKDAYGVSGKGLLVVDSKERAAGLMRMVDRRAARSGDPAIHVVVERFLDKRFDLNYQFTIDRDGHTRLDFVKKALTSGGVHQGHLMPAGLSCAHLEELGRVSQLLGERLYADGFFGVVGVDALLGADGHLYPVLEINARLNMSSYQGRVMEAFHRPRSVALAKHYTVRLHRPVGFAELTESLGDLAAPPTSGHGALITCFGTLNAGFGETQGDAAAPAEGRLYTVLFAPDSARLTELDQRFAAQMDTLSSKEVPV